jgi:hypothetical protein
MQAPLSRARLFALARLAVLLALALPFLGLFATASIAQGDKRAMLEQRVMDIVQMFQNDPRYKGARTAEQVKDGVEFVTGNVLFVLAHETAHALINELGIPVIGREEDGADALATIVALKMGNAFADRIVVNAARGWFLSDQRDKKAGVSTKYYDEHGIDLQRAYYIVCLMVGGAPDRFEALAKEVKMPEERQGSCQGDFSNASWSWGQVLKPHLRKPEDPKTKIEVYYAPTNEYATLAALGQKLQILESIAEWLSEDYVWRKPISLEMQECGEPGARWELHTKKVILCYEIIREFVQLHRGYGQMELVPGTIRMNKKHKLEMSSRYKARNQKAVRAAGSGR